MNHWRHRNPDFVERHGPTPCGPTEDDAVCACGCSGYEEICDEYAKQYVEEENSDAKP